jgi:transposase
VHSDSNAVWAGIDVSKEWIDVAVVRNSVVIEQRRWDCSPAALEDMAARLQQQGVCGAILEPTGGWEVAVGMALMAVGVTAIRINAKRVRDFARAQGVLAKTDPVDARVLALFGERMRPPVRAWLDAERRELADWMARQRQLVDQRTMERNRLQITRSAGARQSIQRMLGLIAKELKRLESELSAWWEQRGGAWQESEERLRSMPGVGPKTARVLIAHMPELGRANRRQIASLAGLAPFACESGHWRGQRHIRGGRAVVRSALYLASWTAVRRAETFRTIYEKLVTAGKPRQLALLAVARRMLVVLNEMMRTQRMWQEARIPA